MSILHHWDKILVAVLAVVALLLLIRKFRKGSCNCGSCPESKKCSGRDSGEER